MKPSRPSGRRPSRNAGVALVITLFIIAMLAFLVVAYFSRATANLQIESASRGAVNAEILARSGADAVLADLRAEIIAGSVAQTPGANAPVYVPANPATAVTVNQNAVPSRVLASPAAMTNSTWNLVYDNLVKQSVGPTFDTAKVGTNAAPLITATTSVTTDAPSANGRYFYWARWQKSELNGVNAFTPNTHMPRWIMMTREGFPASAQTVGAMADLKNYAADNSKAAVGRFAFNVYDTGGLLDINAAGYPPAGPTSLSVTDIQGLKGTLTGADLSVVPGMTDLTAFMTTWKYLGSAATQAKFLTQ